ncbi:Inorganic diphosphatase protein [Dioscorea alata]|uniref:Inorganic diphosphatase protein n=1 Tax=Dioscorea alata TaxID=55571 RepID=A0ACB7UB50_DIOAL|nr:Inorganic diphosphatase protein [Dioscorea alata]
MATTTVLVFYFDKTIIDCDSDNWVIDHLGATKFFDHLLLSLPWNTSMRRVMEELHSQGWSVEDIAEVLKTVPLNPNTSSAIKSAFALGCELRIVSDANKFFIETILEHNGLLNCFSEINTNPGFVDEEGKLCIFPYHEFSFNSSSHGCPLCPPNMCKGLIIERIKAEIMEKGKKRIIYLGDGKGDFCPSLKLSETDFVMPRLNFPVWELICENRDLVKAEVHEWSDFEEQGRVLFQLINKVSIADVTSNAAAAADVHQLIDCKLQTVPISSHATPLPKVLQIRF